MTAVQCRAIIMYSIFYKKSSHKTYIPLLANEGEIWDVFCDFKLIDAHKIYRWVSARKTWLHC